MVSESKKRWKRLAFLEGVGSIFQLFPTQSGSHERFVKRLREISANRPSDYEMFLRDLGTAMNQQLSTLSADEQRRLRERFSEGFGTEGDGSQLTLPYRQ